MRYLSIVFLLAVSLVFSSCKVDESKITISKNDTLIGKLRTEGYYYCKNNDVKNLIVYSDGVILFGVDEYTMNNFEGFENFLLDYEPEIDNQRSWGAIKIDGQKVVMQQMTFKGGLTDKYSEYILHEYTGELLSDSSFTRDKVINDEDDQVITRNDTFLFKSHSYKPDSLNIVVPD